MFRLLDDLGAYGMGKYQALSEFLKNTKQTEVRLSFRKVEQIIGKKLPHSAMAYRAWWSNNPTNSVMTKAWLDEGWKSEQVDMAGEQVTFRKVEGTIHDGVSSSPPLFGCLKGTVHITEGSDLTQPTGETWAAQQGKLYE